MARGEGAVVAAPRRYSRVTIKVGQHAGQEGYVQEIFGHFGGKPDTYEIELDSGERVELPSTDFRSPEHALEDLAIAVQRYGGLPAPAYRLADAVLAYVKEGL